MLLGVKLLPAHLCARERHNDVENLQVCVCVCVCDVQYSVAHCALNSPSSPKRVTHISLPPSSLLSALVRECVGGPL